MNPETPKALGEKFVETALLDWHKPDVQQLTVSIDTGFGTGSVPDAEGAEFSTPSDQRLKQDIKELDQPLEALLAMSYTAPGAQLVPLLTEVIKRQQLKIEALAAQVAVVRSRA